MKQYSFSKFFSGIKISNAQKKFDKHYSKIKFNQEVVDLINDHRQEGAKVVIVTASPDVYMSYFLEKLGYDGLICTKVETKDGIYTGNLSGSNCIGPDKVKRIKESEYYNSNS